MLAAGVLEREPDISDDELLDVLSSNLCRCTGYQNIIKAVRAAVAELRGSRSVSGIAKPPLPELSAVRSRGWRTRRSSRGAAGLPAISAFRIQLHMRVVRSPYAHAELRDIDIGAALALPGVAAVWTGKDIADLPPIDFRDRAGRGTDALSPTAAGQRPACAMSASRSLSVFATDPYLAEDAADLVVIEIEELPALLDAERAAGRLRARPLDRGAASSARNMATSMPPSQRACDRRRSSFAIGRHSGVPLETRGAIGAL